MISEFWTQCKPALRLLAVLTLITGAIYPTAITIFAQIAFPAQADGSLVYLGGHAIGSRLIGQPFDDPTYFWGRPSSTSPAPYNGAASAGANEGPTSPQLLEGVRQRLDALTRAGHLPDGAVPVDLVTASGSGLDPDISVAAALYQVPRVAAYRLLDEAVVRALVTEKSRNRQLLFLGERRVNVLELNLALDAVE